MELQAFLDALFARAKADGIERCEAYISSGDAFEASVFQGEIINYSVSSGMGVSFRALIGGKMGYASTQALDDAAIDMLLTSVAANAQLIESADEQFIFDGAPAYAKYDAVCPELDALSADTKIDWVKQLEQQTLDVDPRITQTEQCVIVSNGSLVRIVNSQGLDVQHKSNMIIAAAFPVAKEGESVNSGMAYRTVRDPAQLELSQIAQESAQDALSGLTAAPVPSGIYKIALQNTAAASLLGTFASIFSADRAQKGMSRLSGKEGEMIASEAVTVMDDPYCSMGLCGAPFDAEGVPAAAKPIIERGKLTTLLHNLKTAKKQGLSASTGNASKASYRSSIGVAPSNLYFVPGRRSKSELLAEMGEGLLITELQGLHSGANIISGDFSLSAKGFVVTGGATTDAVSQITVSGNFYELLKGIEALADDLRFSFPEASHYGSPTLLVKSLSVAGE